MCKSNSKKSRTRVLIENALASLLTRASNLLATLILVPISIYALGVDGYGVVAAAISFSIFFNYSDLGLGAAVVKSVSCISDDKSKLEAQKVISNAWFFLLFVGILVSFIIFIVDSFFITNEVYSGALLACIFVAIGLPFGLYSRILFALQKNLEAGLWQTGSKFLSILVIWLLSLFYKINVVFYLVIFFGVPLLVNIIASFIIFSKRYKFIAPKYSLLNLVKVRSVIYTGVFFTILQIVPYIESGIDSLFLSFKYESNFIAAYDIYFKLFLYIPALVSIGAFPLWPAISRALAENDLEWVSSLKLKSYGIFISISVLTSMLFYFFSEFIVYHWAKHQIIFDKEIVLCMAIFSVGSSLALIQSMFLNGFGLIRQQALFYLKYLFFLLLIKISSLYFLNAIYMILFLAILVWIKVVLIEINSKKWIKLRLINGGKKYNNKN